MNRQGLPIDASDPLPSSSQAERAVDGGARAPLRGGSQLVGMIGRLVVIAAAAALATSPRAGGQVVGIISFLIGWLLISRAEGAVDRALATHRPGLSALPEPRSRRRV